METQAAKPRRSLGRGNPKQLGAETVALFPFPGKVWPAAEFAEAFVSRLESQERALLHLHTNALKERVAPGDLTQCLARTDEPSANQPGVPGLRVRRSGGRSAYWPERELKFKGCRPVTDGTTYPLEILQPGSQRIEQASIPFGTISIEGAMRELLAWAFCREHGLPVHATPVCVFEYIAGRRSPGCCLVSETRGEDRIEAHIEYPACTVEELIRARREGVPAVGNTPVGSELKLRDVNLWWYVEEKSRLLCSMHFAGGFRGILNSNIGNDVLLPKTDGRFDLCLCDFDSFHVRLIPPQPSQAFLDEFVLWTMIEVIKGSLSICEYVKVPDDATAADIAGELGRVYFAKSSLWRAYARRFERAAKACGWNTEAVREAAAKAKQTEAIASVLASSVVNNHYLRQMSGSRAVFYPHN